MIDLPALKLALRLDSGDTTEDDYLTGLEAAAVEAVERWTGRYFGAEDEAAEFVLPGNGAGTLWLPVPASAVSAVTSRAYPGGEETAVLTDAADGWALRRPYGQTHGVELVRKGGSLWDRGTEYVVTATVGYAAGAEPPLIRTVVAELVSHWYEHREPVVVGAGVAKIPLHVQEQLALFRRWGA